MHIVCIGGGPAGLYFGLLMKKLNPAHRVQVIERNKPYDTFGWGVVFSDATMENMRQWDQKTALEVENAFNHWDDIEVLIKGKRMRTTGHGFVGIGRKRLLNILQARCEALGVELAFEREVNSDEEFADADLIIAADGVNSKIRSRHAAAFRPDLVVRPNRFIWLGTNKPFDAFTFDFRRTFHSDTGQLGLATSRREQPGRPEDHHEHEERADPHLPVRPRYLVLKEPRQPGEDGRAGHRPG